MAGGDDDAGGSEPGDQLGRDHLRRERHERPSCLKRCHPGDVALLDGAHVFRLVHALAFGVEERAFEVDAEQSGHTGVKRVPRRGDGFGHCLPRVGDQRRQEAGRAEWPVGRADRGDALDRPGFVEKDAAAAVHLEVDEPRRDQPFDLPPVDPGGNVVGRDDRGDPAGLDNHRLAVAEVRAVEDAGAGQRDPAHRPTLITASPSPC